MPIFEFKCQACQAEFEKLVLSNQDTEPECPCCHSSRVQKLLSAGSSRPHGIPKGRGGFKPPACAAKTS